MHYKNYFFSSRRSAGKLSWFFPHAFFSNRIIVVFSAVWSRVFTPPMTLKRRHIDIKRNGLLWVVVTGLLSAITKCNSRRDFQNWILIMQMNMEPSHVSSAWNALSSIHKQFSDTFSLKRSFEEDPKRAQKFSVDIRSPTTTAADKVRIHIDYSKNLIDDTVIHALMGLAKEAKIEEMRDTMFRGAKINTTENRAVLHSALRVPPSQPYVTEDGLDVMQGITKELSKMACLSKALEDGSWLGYRGDPIRNIVNIGIGGSDLGPKMVCQALKPFAHTYKLLSDSLKVHFVSNIDGFDLATVLAQCRPSETLFVIVSKTFTTWETMENANSAKKWFLVDAKQVVSIELFDIGLHLQWYFDRSPPWQGILWPCQRMQKQSKNLGFLLMMTTCSNFGIGLGVDIHYGRQSV
jgi:Phosphoglucose isomerase